MYRFFEISVISIVQADFGVNVGSVVRRHVKFVGFPICSEEFVLLSYVLYRSHQKPRVA